MWTAHNITFNVVFLALSISAEVLTELKKINRTKEHLNKDLDALHIHVNTTKLPPESHTLRWDDKHASLKATLLVNYIKDLPKLNPFIGEIFGPFDAYIPDLHFGGNLTLENVTITGIKEISFIKSINMQLKPTRIDINASIPKITVEADFILDTIFDNYLPIRDSGHFNATLLDLVLTAVIGPKPVEFHTGNAYQLESAVINIDLKEVQLQMDTKYAEEVKLILDELFKHSEDLILDNDVLNIILKAVNHKLAKIPAKKIVNYLLGPSEPNRFFSYS